MEKQGDMDIVDVGSIRNKVEGMGKDVDKEMDKEVGMGMKVVEEREEEACCAICMESDEHMCKLPCCHKDESSVQFCNECIVALSTRSAISTFCCPVCRSYVAREKGRLVIKKDVGTCSVCHSVSYMASPQLCHDCVKRRIDYSHFRYECEQCHGLQHIPHPMWRYQLTTSSFTSSSARWTCQQGCGMRTTWRLLMEDVPLIPAEERPACWDTSASRFYEIIEGLDEAKQRSIERRTGFWSCVYYAACVAGAVKVLDIGVTLIAVSAKAFSDA